MNYIIACNRHWCESLTEILEAETGHKFHLIANKDGLTMEVVEKINPEYIFFPHWSSIIPEGIYSKYECVIFHMTDLPYGRGGSPLQNLIVRGHQETMLSALKSEEELDAGPIYLKEKLSLHGSAEEIYIRASKQIETMIVKILSEKPEPIEQEGEILSFKRRNPEQGDWSEASSLEEIFDTIRMLDATGYPPAFIEVGPYKLEFSRASLKTDEVIADVKISMVKE